MSDETEEEKNARVSALIQQRLVIELSSSLYENTMQIDAFAFFNANQVVMTETKPRTILLDDLLTMLSPESAAKLVDWPMLGDLRDKVAAQDHVAVIKWLTFIRGTKITDTEFASAHAYLTETQEVQTTAEIIPRYWDVIRGIPGGPNVVSEEQFATAWTAAGRS